MVIYYDGFCKLCTGFVNLAKRHSKPEAFNFIPLQKASIEIPENLSNTVIVETENGKLVGYWEAAAIVMKNMSFPFRVLNRMISIFPPSVKKRIYSFIATNRYRWFGKHDSCQIM